MKGKNIGEPTLENTSKGLLEEGNIFETFVENEKS